LRLDGIDPESQRIGHEAARPQKGPWNSGLFDKNFFLAVQSADWVFGA
jgi:hypothetical protein